MNKSYTLLISVLSCIFSLLAIAIGFALVSGSNMSFPLRFLSNFIFLLQFATTIGIVFALNKSSKKWYSSLSACNIVNVTYARNRIAAIFVPKKNRKGKREAVTQSYNFKPRNHFLYHKYRHLALWSSKVTVLFSYWLSKSKVW